MSGEQPPTFSKYQVVAALDHGGMAEVFLCIANGPAGFRKLHVLKCVKPDRLHEPSMVRMFLDEATLAAQLNHPNVVQTFEVGTEQNRYFIAMEYLEGQSLSALLRMHARTEQTPLPRALHLRILCESMQGLHYAHDLCDFHGRPLNIVHRDVSPQNVFVTYAGAVKVLDFGIAKATSSTTTTEAGTFKGKTAYVAPEQASGDRAVDRRADIFSMGMMLWHAAVGRSMWTGESDIQKVTRIIAGDLKAPRDANPGVPEALDAIVRRALDVDPDQRYQTMAELRSAVEEYLLQHEAPAGHADRTDVLNKLFAKERAAIAERLRTHVEKMELGARLTPIRISTRPQSTTGTSNSGTSASNVGAAILSVTPSHAAASVLVSRGLLLAFVAAGGLMLSGLVIAAYFVFAGRGRHVGPPPAPIAASAPASVSVAAAPATPESAAPATPATVHLAVTVTPKTARARILVDGAPVGESPFSGAVVRNGETHTIRAEAPGFIAAETTLAFDQDRAATLALRPAFAGPAVVLPKSGPPPIPGKPTRAIEKDDPYK